MLIAIPALFAYRYFQRLVQEYTAELRAASDFVSRRIISSESTSSA